MPKSSRCAAAAALFILLGIFLIYALHASGPYPQKMKSIRPCAGLNMKHLLQLFHRPQHEHRLAGSDCRFRRDRQI